MSFYINPHIPMISRVTELLEAARRGDQQTAARLLPHQAMPRIRHVSW